MSSTIDAGCIREPQVDQMVPGSLTRGLERLLTSCASSTGAQCEQNGANCDVPLHHTRAPTIEHHMHALQNYKRARKTESYFAKNSVSANAVRVLRRNSTAAFRCSTDEIEHVNTVRTSRTR